MQKIIITFLAAALFAPAVFGQAVKIMVTNQTDGPVDKVIVYAKNNSYGPTTDIVWRAFQMFPGSSERLVMSGVCEMAFFDESGNDLSRSEASAGQTLTLNAEYKIEKNVASRGGQGYSAQNLSQGMVHANLLADGKVIQTQKLQAGQSANFLSDGKLHVGIASGAIEGGEVKDVRAETTIDLSGAQSIMINIKGSAEKPLIEIERH